MLAWVAVLPALQDATVAINTFSLDLAAERRKNKGHAGEPDLTAVATQIPETPPEMYRHAAALEITHRRDLLLRGLRQRGVFAFELVPGLLASSIVNQYLDIKERSLL